MASLRCHGAPLCGKVLKPCSVERKHRVRQDEESPCALSGHCSKCTVELVRTFGGAQHRQLVAPTLTAHTARWSGAHQEAARPETGGIGGSRGETPAT